MYNNNYLISPLLKIFLLLKLKKIFKYHHHKLNSHKKIYQNNKLLFNKQKITTTKKNKIYNSQITDKMSKKIKMLHLKYNHNNFLKIYLKNNFKKKLIYNQLLL